MESVIAIIIPVLARPANVAPLLDSIRRNTRIPHTVLFVTSPNDREELAAIRAHNADFITLDRLSGSPGEYSLKTNLGYRSTTEPYIFTGADDLYFHPNWDTNALAHMTDGIGVVGTNDLGNPKVLAGQHSTHSLVARWYADTLAVFDQPGAIYSPEYPHHFVDDELCQVAKLNSAWSFAADSHVEHKHPNFSKAPTDALYDRTQQQLERSRTVYRQRRQKWTRKIRTERRATRGRR